MRNLVETHGGPFGSASGRALLGHAIQGALLAPILILGAASASAQSTDAGAIVKESCATCHTQSGNSAAPPFPKLSGLAPDYLAKQMRDVASGKRSSDIMGPILDELSRGEINALAEYFARQPRTPGIVTRPDLVDEGERVYREGNKEAGVPACAGCHTPDGGGAPRFPMIAAQNADYVVQQLKQFRSGERSNDFGKLMRTVVSRLTDAEILAVAQYVASMPVPPSAR
ncbi:c-type cytochrome [Imhoffiella purpurea]|uniref:Cytochrome c-type protein n=1 Tax=Imhoffiella purpurea TaxID=1249627 RepID=W9V5T8_9GAMM|nr:c-type cytochrome [Imhoffiella purpurea]EXJ14893.1 cytochrome c-type protein [Imhoffiella purpurea]